jgi:hypothetical protein
VPRGCLAAASSSLAWPGPEPWEQGFLAVGDTLAPRAAQAASGGNTILGQSNDAGAGLASLASSNRFATLEMTSGRRPRGDRGAGDYTWRRSL